MESQQLLHQKIEDLRSKAKPRSHQTDKIISQLKDKGIVILESQLDRQTVVVWIWCRSQTALDNMQKLYESNQLRDVFLEVIQIPLLTLINIDDNQFKKTIAVVRALSISFTHRINIQENMFPSRVTKLRNEIYILFVSSSLPPVMHVFEDEHPFHLQKDIELTEIRIADDIGSNETGNCLYVTEFLMKSVWKITRDEDGGHKIIKWLKIDFLPQSMSVSTDGRFMIFNYSSLTIYGSDAELIRSIQLPTYFGIPRRAVETSIGNFIIHHTWIEEKVDSESHGRKRAMKWCISELSRDGQVVIRRFIPSNETQQLKNPEYFSIDSEDRVFVVDSRIDRVILLDSNLRWNRIIIPTGEKEETRISRPNRLCYDEEKKQLIVAGIQVNVYSISRT